jgi:hypothetical protein
VSVDAMWLLPGCWGAAGRLRTRPLQGLRARAAPAIACPSSHPPPISPSLTLRPTRSSYQRGGIVTQHKAGKTLAFKTLAQVCMGGGWVVRRGAAGFALAVTSLFKEACTEDSFAGHA